MILYRVTWSIMENTRLAMVSSHISQPQFSSSKNFGTKEKALEFQKSIIEAAAKLDITGFFRTTLHEEVLE